MQLNKIVAAATVLVASALLAVACTSQSSSVSPVGPSGLAGASALEDPGIPESCTDGKDNDGDKLIDCADADCAEECKNPPPPSGPPCSPGWWKQTGHQDEFEAACAEVESETGGAWTCEELWFAITCNGGPNQGCTGANRQAATALLNGTSQFGAGGCTE